MMLIKIGGGEKINLAGIIGDLAGFKDQFIIVHGANYLRDSIMAKMGRKKEVIRSASGYDSVFSDEEMIDFLMMSYAGVRNKRIVELCQQNGINAVGLSGVDGRCIQGVRNKGIRTYRDGKLIVLRDYSAKAKAINKDFLNLLLSSNYVPVLTVPIIDENNFAVNSENDDIIALLQSEFKADVVINLIEERGLLDENGVLIKSLLSSDLLDSEAGQEGRIKRKTLSIRKLFETSKPKCIISDGRVEHPITDALLGKGTVIE